MGSNSSKHIMQWKEKADDDEDEDAMIICCLSLDIYFDALRPPLLRHR